jgi:hypothetical protein
LERLNGSVAGQGAGDGSAVCLRDVRGQPGATVRRDCSSSIGELQPLGLALVGTAVQDWPIHYAPRANGRLPAAGPGGHVLPAGLDRVDFGGDTLQPLSPRGASSGQLPPPGRCE